MTSSSNDAVALSQVLAAQAGGRLPLSSALYACGEVARLVASEHELGRTVTGLDADHIRCTRSGGLVLGGARVHTPDVRSDVQAVGAIFYRLLTGKAPAAGEVFAPSHFNPGVDSELDAVILSALAPDPSQRPASVRVLETALAAVFEELEVTPSGDELASVVAGLPRRPIIVSRPPPAGWYAAEASDEDEEEGLSTAEQIPSWQVQERERKWMVGISAALVAVALLWALWPAPKMSRASQDDTPRARVTARR
jgi:hypothetical protein